MLRENEHRLLWPTSILVRRYDEAADINVELTRVARDWVERRMNHRTAFKHAYPGSVAIYQRSPAILRLLEMVEESVAEYLRLFDLSPEQLHINVNTFANVETGGEWSLPHAHHGNQLVATYYPKVHAPPPNSLSPTFAGQLLFYPPYALVPDYMVRRVNAVFPVAVETGSLVVFPGYLQHSTVPFASHDHEKVALITNVRFARAEDAEWRTYETPNAIRSIQGGA